jgi:SAM-dependent methyltransferase
MKEPDQKTEVPDYGVDAPDVVRRFLMIGSAALVVNFAMPSLIGLVPPQARLAALSIGRSLGWVGWSLIAATCVMLWGSRVGKLRVRDKLLGAMPWRGDERVLDVGCGHGLMLAGVAQRLSSGRAIGIDIWRPEDQARNSPEATLRNMRLEGVSARVEVRTADARALPFDAASFDVVVSSWALHNIASDDERRRAIEEIVRVLRPGGRLALIDIRHARSYAAQLAALGLEGVTVGAPNFLFLMPSRSVVARKPS